MNREAQDYFRMHIQPFLALRCGQAGCHGAYGKSDFHVSKGGALQGQRSNDVSLDSAARFLDHENIEATTLWLKTTTAHGSQGAPSLTTTKAAERELLNRLRQWHLSVNRSNTVVVMSPMVQVEHIARAPSSAEVSSNRMVVGTNASAKGIVREHENSPAPSTATVGTGAKLPEIGDELLALEREITKLEEKERAKKTSNRHDPEEFNRRFGGKNP